MCSVEEHFDCIQCEECWSYICNWCDASIEYDKIVYCDLDNHIYKIFENHVLVCPKTKIEQTNDYMEMNQHEWNERYCNKCKNKNNELRDIVMTFNDDPEVREYITYEKYMGDKYINPIFPLEVVDIETYPKEPFEIMMKLKYEDANKPKDEYPSYLKELDKNCCTVTNVTIRGTMMYSNKTP